MGSNSKHIYTPKKDSKNTKLVKALHGALKQLDTVLPETKGVFGHEFTIKTDGVVLNSSQFDFEFEAPFDDDLEADEARITAYNLTDNTINKFKWNNSLTIMGGHKGDTGELFEGRISKVFTKYEGADKVTTISVLDDGDLSQDPLENVTYKANTKASYILRDLLDRTKLPIGEIKVRRDWTYKDETTIDGMLPENIKRYAEVCGISVYIHKGKIYARHLTVGDNLNFLVCADTGMIGSPSPFEEEVTAEDYKETVKGFNISMILQHRMATAGIVELKSRQYKGTYRIRSGRHSFDGTNAITEIEVI